MKPRYYILTLLLFWTGVLFAQDVKFTASASKTEVGTGEEFQVEFSLNANANEITPPDLSSFQVLSGPNMSTSMSSINRNTTMSVSYSYVLMAAKEGEYTIGPATAIVNGRKLTTKPIKIKVVKGRAVPQNNQQQNAGGGGNAIEEARSADLAKNLFIRAVVDRNNVYQGEQITLRYRLYTRIDIEQTTGANAPELNGFWNEEIKNTQQQIQFHIETYKGARYEVADLKKVILFPEHSGDLTIDPLSVGFVVRVQAPSRDVFDQFFGSYKELKYTAKSPPLVVHVKPLPDTGKPASFTGAVGRFNIEASIDKTALKANDALNYKVKVSGSGNIKLLKTLNTAFPADFDKFDPKITDSVMVSENGVSGDRYYNYLLIPRHHGDYAIDPLKFSYFNPATNKYVTLTTKDFHIKVAKGPNENNVTVYSGEGSSVKELGKDIRYIKTGDGGLAKQGGGFFGSAGYFALLLLGPVLCYGAFSYRNRVRKINSDIVKVKSRRAGKVAAKHLANAQRELAANNQKVFYEEVFKGLYGYLGDKLNIDYANLDRETIASALKERSVNGEVASRLQDTLDLCEMARYAPVNHISKQQVFEKAKGIINDIENEI